MFKTILVPVELTGVPPHIEAFASRFAAEQQATLHFLYVVDEGRDFEGAAYTMLEPSVIAFHDREIRTLLAKLVDDARATGAAAESHIVEGRPASEMILSAIAALKADLVIMRTHGRAGLSRALSGSVTEDVLRHSRIPVLALRDP
jgi:nucleotide-binding universal stress UspA family protein